MDPNTLKLLMGSAGAGAVADKLYIEDVFSTYLYTGNGSTQTITNGIDLSGKGGLVWIKARSSTTGHRFVDTVRGATKSLDSSSASPESTESTGLTSFGSTGFTLGADSSYNGSTDNVSWSFRKAAKFFDVVTYTGNDVNRTIAHNLGSVPGCIIIKRINGFGAVWQVYHRSLANSEYLVLSGADPKTTNTDRWNSTTPTSTEFSLGTSPNVNANGLNYVAYLFAHDAGGFGDSGNDNVISCGSFTTDSSGTASITLGWEPQFLLAKRSSGAEDWYVFDTMRGWTAQAGANDAALNPSLSSAEFLRDEGSPFATGFTYTNGSASSTYIYIAIRRGPMKTPTDATKVFGQVARSGTNANVTVSGGHTVDLAIIKERTFGDNWVLASRLTGTNYLRPNSVIQEQTDTTSTFQGNAWDSMTGVKLGTDSSGASNTTGQTYINYLFKRAAGFFDVVTYTGTGSARTVSHNLGVTPELLVVKGRSLGASWNVYNATIGATKVIFLNTDAANSTSSAYWNNTSPTSSVFTVGTGLVVNGSGDTFISYLFASCSGVSKVGSYTGTGTTLSVDCGFTAGARFVLIKRTDSTGDWYVWDTARGIVSGNDPFLLLNSTNPDNTTTDYIDPLSTGFQISSTAPAAINASGGTYIYLSVA